MLWPSPEFYKDPHSDNDPLYHGWTLLGSTNDSYPLPWLNKKQDNSNDEKFITNQVLLAKLNCKSLLSSDDVLPPMVRMYQCTSSEDVPKKHQGTYMFEAQIISDEFLIGTMTIPWSLSCDEAELMIQKLIVMI